MQPLLSPDRDPRRLIVRDETSTLFGGGGRFVGLTGRRVTWLVTYSLPLALIGLGVYALWPSNASRIWVALVLLIWTAGLALQSIVAMALLRLMGRYPTSLTLTLTGIWLVPSGQRVELDDPSETPQPRAGDLLTLWAIVLLILVAGAGWWLTVQQFVTERPTTIESAATAASWWSIPSLGDSEVDQPFAAAAWLWCLQAVWQSLPLPQSLGRVGWSCLFAMLSGGPNRDPQRCLIAMRRFLVTIAVLLLVATAWGMRWASVPTPPLDSFSTIIVPPRGLLLGMVLIALWLFASTGGADLARLQLWLFGAGETGRLRSTLSPSAWIDHARQQRREREQHRRLVEVMASERREANDARRAEEVLQRLHDDGLASLSKDDRELLERVSEAVRRQRS